MEEKKHVRRVHYSGTHPKKYSEKYKELNPEKYADTIEHVISKGSTPAGMHISIMVNEILDALDIKPGEQGLDATLGYGGHTRAMLEKLEHKGHMYATDVDPIESAKTRDRLAGLGFGEDILTIKLMNFANVDVLAKEVGTFDFVLADLGVSSMQIDNPERGFSYKLDGPLDLRLDPTSGVSAAERLAGMNEYEIAGMLEENSDEPYADLIAKHIAQANRKHKSPATTFELKAIIEEALTSAGIPKKDFADTLKKTCARVFQALRIDVNNEFEVLYAFLDKLPHILSPGGRAAILTFHSGEDKLVKKSFRQYEKEGLYSAISEDAIRPTPAECQRNSRAHSTKLRWAVKRGE